MSSYQYYSSTGSKIAVTNKINFCLTEGPMSFCKAVTVADQHGCKYREDATRTDCCMHWRERYNNACDCIWAQKNIDKPKLEEDDEAEQAITVIPT